MNAPTPKYRVVVRWIDPRTDTTAETTGEVSCHGPCEALSKLWQDGGHDLVVIHVSIDKL